MKHKWKIIDADDNSIGRVASKADCLRVSKNKPIYYHKNMFIVVNER